jgi:hypothetical protein
MRNKKMKKKKIGDSKSFTIDSTKRNQLAGRKPLKLSLESPKQA